MRIDYDNGYYIGDVDSNDERHGFGTYYWNNGERYEGDWVHGKITGKGTYYYSNGQRYEGGFLDSNFYGSGTLYQGNDSIKGDWQDSDNATNVIFTYGRNFHRGNIVNGRFVLEIEQWSTQNSSHCAAVHPENRTIKYGSMHNNDKHPKMGERLHIHLQDGGMLYLDDCGNQIKVTYVMGDMPKKEAYMPKFSSKDENIERAKKLFNK